MKVKAAEGLKVPKEDNPQTYFGTEEEEVENVTPYIVRRLAAGELVEVTTTSKARKAAGGDK